MTPAMTILYVENAAASADFYEKLFGIAPTERADTFSLFRLPTGLVLGLWSRAGVEPTAQFTGGGCELAIRAPGAADVDATHARWSALGIPVLQAPAKADFGRTFTVSDPDGHRIRVFNPPA
ncbi:drug:proton antiporter [Rhizobium sp. Root274]|uniref:VOC family protein n=1 Tax=unclassified Rhizobium TaxID=2613769 RepID=UPI000714AC5F|nr:MULTISPECIES: VOC family protein [unclassified Rhizobium]KQW29399.1 drug:proton antiporter [Rhizobium sp. Root1240]KRD29966.1 drug:proton antiporter [Rhizobium sp. Root274]